MLIDPHADPMVPAVDTILHDAFGLAWRLVAVETTGDDPQALLAEVGHPRNTYRLPVAHLGDQMRRDPWPADVVAANLAECGMGDPRCAP